MFTTLPALLLFICFSQSCLFHLGLFFMTAIRLHHSSWQIAAAHVSEVAVAHYSNRLAVMLVWLSLLGGIYHRISLLSTLQAWLVISLLCLNCRPSLQSSLHPCIFSFLCSPSSNAVSPGLPFFTSMFLNHLSSSLKLFSHSLSVFLSSVLYLSG